MPKVSTNKVNKLVRLAKRGTIDVDQYIYFETGTTDVDGLITFSWLSNIPGLPAVFFTPIPGGGTNPSYNHVFYVTDFTPSSDFEGTVTVYVGSWDTAVISAQTVLIDSTTPVQNMKVQCLFVHNTLLG